MLPTFLVQWLYSIDTLLSSWPALHCMKGDVFGRICVPLRAGTLNMIAPRTHTILFDAHWQELRANRSVHRVRCGESALYGKH